MDRGSAKILPCKTYLLYSNFNFKQATVQQQLHPKWKEKKNKVK